MTVKFEINGHNQPVTCIHWLAGKALVLHRHFLIPQNMKRHSSNAMEQFTCSIIRVKEGRKE